MMSIADFWWATYPIHGNHTNSRGGRTGPSAGRAIIAARIPGKKKMEQLVTVMSE